MALGSLPPNIRVNTQVPFPAMVTGSGPITLAKSNGVWQVGFSVAQIQSIVPPSGDFPTDLLFGFDSKRGQFFQVSITNLLAALPSNPAPTQRLVTTSPITIVAADQIINCNIASGSPTCTLPQASTRAGQPLVFKDVGAQFLAHPLTLTPFAGDTIDGAGTLVLGTNRQSVRLVPANDGTTVGWSIEQ